MGANIGCCCHKSRGRTKSEIIKEDDKIEKLTESLKGGSIVSNKLSRENSQHSFQSQGSRKGYMLNIDQTNLLSDINRSEYQTPQNAKLVQKSNTYYLHDDDIENENKLTPIIKMNSGSPQEDLDKIPKDSKHSSSENFGETRQASFAEGRPAQHSTDSKKEYRSANNTIIESPDAEEVKEESSSQQTFLQHRNNTQSTIETQLRIGTQANSEDLFKISNSKSEIENSLNQSQSPIEQLSVIQEDIQIQYQVILVDQNNAQNENHKFLKNLDGLKFIQTIQTRSIDQMIDIIEDDSIQCNVIIITQGKLVEELLKKYHSSNVLQSKTRGIIVFCKDMYKYIQYEVDEPLINDVITDFYSLYHSISKLIYDLETTYLDTGYSNFELPPAIERCRQQIEALAKQETAQVTNKEELIEKYRDQQHQTNIERRESHDIEGKDPNRKSISQYNKRISKVQKEAPKLRAQSPKSQPLKNAFQYSSQGYLQQASHGIKSYWIFYYQKEKQNKLTKVQINDLIKAGFNLQFFNSIKESERFLSKTKNKKLKREIIAIAHEDILDEVIKYFEQNPGTHHNIIVFSQNEVNSKVIQDTHPEIIFSVENNYFRVAQALNECFYAIYHDKVKDLARRPQNK